MFIFVFDFKTQRQMKIKNISNQDLTIPMKKTSGQKMLITLTPEQFVYSEAEKKYENKQLIIWERKQLIEITDEPLPKNGEYCHPYKSIKLAATNLPKGLRIEDVLIDPDDDDSVEDETVPLIDESIIENDEPADDDIKSVDNIKSENSLDSEVKTEKKGKGGRPPGAKNKDKRGKKKQKRAYNKKVAPINNQVE